MPGWSEGRIRRTLLFLDRSDKCSDASCIVFSGNGFPISQKQFEKKILSYMLSLKSRANVREVLLWVLELCVYSDVKIPYNGSCRYSLARKLLTVLPLGGGGRRNG